LESLEAVGQRVAAARAAQGLTQTQVAERAGLERSALAKIERGQRQLSAVELARLAGALSRPLDWFVRESPPAVVSRRGEATGAGAQAQIDLLIDQAARDVELLLELGLLRTSEWPRRRLPPSLSSAAEEARRVREQLDVGDEPLDDLLAVAERLGLHGFSHIVDADGFDGAYVALEGAGVAVVNGVHPSGRRRFTLAHELGHHLFADAYATDWAVWDGAAESERVLNAFAANLLLPRGIVRNRWERLGDEDDIRSAAIALGIEYRLSWSALCAQLRNCGVIDQGQLSRLLATPPRRAEYLELGRFPVQELEPPAVSPAYAKAVLKGYRSARLGGFRTVELLRGTVTLEDLPDLRLLPIESLYSEFGSPL
jgi:transcriptional regulator with XRE-family HTH domain